MKELKNYLLSFPLQVLPLQSLHFSVLSDAVDDCDTHSNDAPSAHSSRIHTLDVPSHYTAEEACIELENKGNSQDNNVEESENMQSGAAYRHGLSNYGTPLVEHSRSCRPMANIHSSSEGELPYRGSSEAYNAFDHFDAGMSACSCTLVPFPVIQPALDCVYECADKDR